MKNFDRTENSQYFYYKHENIQDLNGLTRF